MIIPTKVSAAKFDVYYFMLCSIINRTTFDLASIKNNIKLLRFLNLLCLENQSTTTP